MNFEYALSELKKGNRACREGWNNYCKYVQLIDNRNWNIEKSNLLYDSAITNILVLMEKRQITPWTPSISDILANDWVVYDMHQQQIKQPLKLYDGRQIGKTTSIIQEVLNNPTENHYVLVPTLNMKNMMCQQAEELGYDRPWIHYLKDHTITISEFIHGDLNFLKNSTCTWHIDELEDVLGCILQEKTGSPLTLGTITMSSNREIIK